MRKTAVLVLLLSVAGLGCSSWKGFLPPDYDKCRRVRIEVEEEPAHEATVCPNRSTRLQIGPVEVRLRIQRETGQEGRT